MTVPADMTVSLVSSDTGAQAPALKLTGVNKHFGTVWANRNIDLTVEAGSIHGLLGENGAGKSTLMKILFGMIRPDSGRIEVGATPVSFRSSADALECGIGMVQQHFSLIGKLTVAENLVLGRATTTFAARWIRRLDLKSAERRARELSERLGFGIDPSVRCERLSVGVRQKVEILKALWGGAKVLILDEPTAALSPTDAEELYRLLERLRDGGTTIILISHKLPEIMKLCRRVTVLRDGEVVGEEAIPPGLEPGSAQRTELEGRLVRLMIGRNRPEVPSRARTLLPNILDVAELEDGERIGPISFTLGGGEILAMVGVEGNGQTELIELLTGIRRARSGSILLGGEEIVDLPTRGRFQRGLAHIPEDRHANAVADAMDLVDNATIGFNDDAPLSPNPFWLSRRRRTRFTKAIIARHQVRAASADAPMSSLSGGNQQKLVVGRELARAPRLMVAAQPTRGLDIGSTAAVHHALVKLREAGSAVLLFSLDLSEVFTIADRILVLRGGRIAGETTTAEADIDQIGHWMSGSGAAA